MKELLSDENFLKAMNLLKNHQKIRLINHLYPDDYEEQPKYPRKPEVF